MRLLAFAEGVAVPDVVGLNAAVAVDGIDPNPTLSTLTRIAEGLDLSLADLLGTA